MDLAIVSKMGGLLIPIMGIVGGVLLPIAIVALVLQSQQRQRAALLDTVKHLADRGLAVPPELLDPPRRAGDDNGPRFRAITLVGVGVGLALMFWLLNLEFLMGIGALLVCIGIAQLIAVRLDRVDAGKA
jgi:Flp pilus assembly protein TadB